MTDTRPDPYTEQVAPRYQPEAEPLKPRPKRRLIPSGCQHTEDPAGWITDENGTITDRCNCGEVPA